MLCKKFPVRWVQRHTIMRRSNDRCYYPHFDCEKKKDSKKSSGFFALCLVDAKGENRPQVSFLPPLILFVLCQWCPTCRPRKIQGTQNNSKVSKSLDPNAHMAQSSEESVTYPIYVYSLIFQMSVDITLVNKIYICVNLFYWIHNSLLSLCIFKSMEIKCAITYSLEMVKCFRCRKGEWSWGLAITLSERASWTSQTQLWAASTTVLCPFSLPGTRHTGTAVILWLVLKSCVLSSLSHLWSREGAVQEGRGSAALARCAVYLGSTRPKWSVSPALWLHVEGTLAQALSQLAPGSTLLESTWSRCLLSRKALCQWTWWLLMTF